MLNRRVLIAAVSAFAIGVCFSPGAAVGNSSARDKRSRHTISETRKVINVGFLGKPGTSSFRAIKAGTIDGWIGKVRIHGALRALRKIVSSEEILQGTEFDSRGGLARSWSISGSTSATDRLSTAGPANGPAAPAPTRTPEALSRRAVAARSGAYTQCT
jgi:hypothetical protein